MPAEAPPRWKELTALAVGGLVLLVAIRDPAVPLPLAGVVLLLWAAVGLWHRVVGAIGFLAPAAAAILEAQPPMLVAAGVAAMGIWILVRLELIRHIHDRETIGLRMEVGRGLYQQSVLHRQIARYPRLLDICSRLFAAQEKGQLAKLISDEVQSLIPDTLLVRITIGTDQSEPYRFQYGQDDGSHLRHERFVLDEQRPQIERSERSVAVYVPLRGDRRRPGLTDQEQRAVLTVVFSPQGLEDYLLIDVLEALGRLAGLSLASVRLLEQARSLALFDDLTGLYGQHEFLRRLDEQIARSRREESGLAVIMCDMDHLKAFNDTYGHPAGDDALRAIAQLIRNMLPEDGIACRYGGEEFAIMLDQDDRISEFCEQLCSAIRALTLPNDARVTASLGWAMLRDDDETGRSFLHRADVACYNAKRAGRDQVQEAT